MYQYLPRSFDILDNCFYSGLQVTQGWLEPLLERAGNDDVFICPVIDLLAENTLEYIKSNGDYLGAFNWRLSFRWVLPSNDILKRKSVNPSKPYPTPAMAGGLFAVRQGLFWHLGSYDKGMRIWGAENLEISWRAWQCGARVEISPCSRVGHIFRQQSPYNYPGGVEKVLTVNLVRAAMVWMDEWAGFLFKFNPWLTQVRDQQVVADRVELKKSLQCKSFKWYLENVWPQHFFPTDSRWFGRIRNSGGGCIGIIAGTSGAGFVAKSVVCGSHNDLYSLVVYTPEGKIMIDNGLCLEQGVGNALWAGCKDNVYQIWIQRGPRLTTFNRLCLTILTGERNKYGVGETLTAAECIMPDARQMWIFERVPWN